MRKVLLAGLVFLIISMTIVVTINYVRWAVLRIGIWLGMVIVIQIVIAKAVVNQNRKQK